MIKNYEHGGVRMSKQSNRELQLSQIIEGIYKLFGEINTHLKKVLDPQQGKSNFYIIQTIKPVKTTIQRLPEQVPVLQLSPQSQIWLNKQQDI